MRGATLMMGVHHSIFTDAAMANSVLQILYKSCKIQMVVLHKLKNRLASMPYTCSEHCLILSVLYDFISVTIITFYHLLYQQPFTSFCSMHLKFLI